MQISILETNPNLRSGYLIHYKNYVYLKNLIEISEIVKK